MQMVGLRRRVTNVDSTARCEPAAHSALAGSGARSRRAFLHGATTAQGGRCIPKRWTRERSRAPPLAPGVIAPPKARQSWRSRSGHHERRPRRGAPGGAQQSTGSSLGDELPRHRPRSAGCGAGVSADCRRAVRSRWIRAPRWPCDRHNAAEPCHRDRSGPRPKSAGR